MSFPGLHAYIKHNTQYIVRRTLCRGGSRICGKGGAAATASAAGAKVFGGSRLKTLFRISKGGRAPCAPPPESASVMQPFSDTRDVEQRETSLLTVAKQRDDVPPISIYLFECVIPINVISISFIYIMYNCDAGCQGGMKNQSVAMQQDLYGSEHSLANESFDFALGVKEKTLMLVERQLRIYCLHVARQHNAFRRKQKLPVQSLISPCTCC